MNNILKKICLLMSILLIGMVSLTACINKPANSKENELLKGNRSDINNNTKALNIANMEILDIPHGNENINITNKIENNSTFDVSDIWIEYDELDKNDNLISESKAFVNITLNPSEVAYAEFSYKEYTDKIRVTGYRYKAMDKSVFVDLKNDNINIEKDKDRLEDSRDYEVLITSDPYKVNESKEGSTYKIKVKNSSSKDLGNITLKIGELNEDNEYIIANHIAFYNVLKSSEEVEIDVKTSINTSNIKILGYIYDDVSEKANIDIDLKSHKAKINK